MPEEQTESLSLVAAYPFAAEHGLAQQAAEIRNMAIDGFKNKSSVRRGYMLKLLQDNNLLTDFVEKHWSFGKTPDGTRAISAADDETYKVWDLATGEEIATFTGESPILFLRLEGVD